MRIGNVISVWGRPLKLVSCDDFTKNYYATKYGVNGFNTLQNKALPKEKEHVAKQVRSELGPARVIATRQKTTRSRFYPREAGAG